MHNAKRRKPKRLSIESLEPRDVPALFVVTTTDDVVDKADRKLSLREALTRANTSPNVETIVLRAGEYRITLPEDSNNPDGNVGGDFDITNPVIIRGVGAARSILNGGGTQRLFDVIGPIAAGFVSLAIGKGGGQNDGSAIHATSANITVRNALLTNNSSLKGGAINDETGNVTVIGSQIINNKSTTDGGGINMGTGTLKLIGSKLDGNTATGAGGGVSSAGAVSVLRRSVISNNKAEGGAGGGIHADSLTIDLSELAGNTASGAGGAMRAPTVNIARSTVHDNTARTGGGIHAGNATITKSSVTTNSAKADPSDPTETNGGGIAGTNLVLIQSTIDDNSAEGSGGGIYALTSVSASKSAVTNNRSGTSGGGIRGLSVHVDASTISGNKAKTAGGGINAKSASVTRSVIRDNSALGGVGGGINGTNITVTDSTIANNDSSDDGGGIFASGIATLTNSTINDNTSKYETGGGLYVETANMTNCTVSGNTATFGGGGIAAKNGTLVNITVTHNTAYTNTGGIYLLPTSGSPGQIKIANSIIAQNVANSPDLQGTFQSLGHNLIGDPTGSGSSFSAAAGDLVGTAEKPLDPILGELAANGGPTLTRTLLKGSPAIDAGDNSFATTLDQRGRRRIRNGNGDRIGTVDIGAFER